MTTLDPTIRGRLDTILASVAGKPGPLLLVLHEVQQVFGYIPAETLPVIATALNLSRAEVHGVVTFYHFFRVKPAGRHTVQVCRAESCQAVKGEALAEHARRRLGIDFDETTPDGQFSLLPVFCLGNCACSPAIMIDEELYGRVTPDSFDALIAERGKRS